MIKQLYVSSRVIHAAMWRGLRKNHNWPIRSSWIDQAGPGETPDMSQHWATIVGEILQSDALLLYFQPDDFPLKGALVECGVALAYNRPVFIMPTSTAIVPVTYRPIGSWIKHPLVKLVPSDARHFERTVLRIP
jgi:hypothetical protein